MNERKRRQYRAWLIATMEKGAQSKRETEWILRGQLLLPARDRDAGLMQKCAAALYGDDAKASEDERRVWNMISGDIKKMEEAAARQRAFKRHTGLVLALVLTVALAAAGLAAALSPHVFSFLWGQDTPNAFVQEDAAGLVKTGLGSIEKEHVAVTIREAAYDGQELRVVYSVRDKSATRLYTYDDEALLGKAAALNDMDIICDWVVVNGDDVFLSDCGTNPGEQNGELLFYFQALMADQGVQPQGDFTVGLPLGNDLSGERPKSFVPAELQFTINATEAMKLVRTAAPAGVTVDGVRLAMTEATFTPVAGSIRLDVTGEDPLKTRSKAIAWGLDAKLYTKEGVQVGQQPVSSFVQPDGADTPPTAILMRIVPPDIWPEEMILALPDKDGKPDAADRIIIKLEGK